MNLFWHVLKLVAPTKLVSVHPTAGDVLAKSYGLQLVVHAAMTLEDWQVKHEGV